MPPSSIQAVSLVPLFSMYKRSELINLSVMVRGYRYGIFQCSVAGRYGCILFAFTIIYSNPVSPVAFLRNPCLSSTQTKTNLQIYDPTMTTPKTSRELLHRLLHATDTSKQPSHRDTTTRGIPATKKPPQGTERHGDGEGADQPDSRREELLARQARKLLRQDDMFRKVNSRNASSSNSHDQPKQHRTKVVATGAAARTSAIPRIPDRRYNRDRDLRERKRQRLDDLAAALKAVKKGKTKKQTTTERI
jgi:nitrate reductase NapE component